MIGSDKEHLASNIQEVARLHSTKYPCFQIFPNKANFHIQIRLENPARYCNFNFDRFQLGKVIELLFVKISQRLL